MKRMTGLVLVIVFLVLSSLGLAFFVLQLNSAGVLLSGKVSKVEKGPQYSFVTLDTPGGQAITISSKSHILDRIKVGDGIRVRDLDKWALYIEKTDSQMGKIGSG